MAMPEYTDGVLDLYQIEEDTSEDYPLVQGAFCI